MRTFVKFAGSYIAALAICLPIAFATGTDESDTWPTVAFVVAIAIYVIYASRHKWFPKHVHRAVPPAQSLWNKLPPSYRDEDETVLWEGHAAVQTAAIGSGGMMPVDVAGEDHGFVVLTDRRLVVGNLSAVRRKPEVWDAFAVSSLIPVLDHPRGIAFQVKQVGPINLVLAMPSRGLSDLRTAAADMWL